MLMYEYERKGNIYRRIIRSLRRLAVQEIAYREGWLIVTLQNGSIFKTHIPWLKKEDLKGIKEKLNLA